MRYPEAGGEARVSWRAETKQSLFHVFNTRQVVSDVM